MVQGKQPSERKKIMIRSAIWLFSIIAVILVAAQLFLLLYLDPMIEKAVKDKVDQESGGLYTIDFDNLSINIFTQSIKVVNLTLKPDYEQFTQKHHLEIQQNFYEASMPLLAIQNIHLLALYFNKDLIINKIKIEEPEIDILSSHNDTSSTAMKIDISSLTDGVIRSLKVKHFIFTNASIEIREDTKKAPNVLMENLSLTLNDFGTGGEGKMPSPIVYGNFTVKGKNLSFHLNNPYAQLSIGKINGSSARQTLTAEAIKLTPDSVHSEEIVTKDRYAVMIPSIELTGIDLLSALKDKALFINKLNLSHPLVKIYKMNTPDTVAHDVEWMTSRYLKSIEINQLHLDSGSIEVYHNFKSPGHLRIGSVNLELNDFKPVQFMKGNLPDDAGLILSDLSFNLPDSLNVLTIASAVASIKDSSLQVTDFHLAPRYPKYQYGKMNGFETDRIDLQIDQTKVLGINFKKLFNEEGFKASRVIVDSMKVVVFRDKRLPDPVKRQSKLPHEILRTLNYQLHIDSLNISNSFISYEEHDDEGKEPGIVAFHHLDAKLSNITNETAFLRQGISAKIIATANVMGTGFLKLNFDFPLGDKNGKFSFNGSLGKINLSDVNSMMENNAFVHIKSGVADKIAFAVEANDHSATGKMQFYYNDLKISLIDKNTQKTRGVGVSLGSLIANTFVVKKNNQQGDEFREGKMYFVRDKRKSIFNYWWYTILSGLKSSVGVKNKGESFEKMD